MSALYEASEQNLKAKVAECAQLAKQVQGGIAGLNSQCGEKNEIRKTLQETKERLNRSVAFNNNLEQKLRSKSNELHNIKN